MYRGTANFLKNLLKNLMNFIYIPGHLQPYYDCGRECVGLDTPPLVPGPLEPGKLTSGASHVQSNGDHRAACHGHENSRLVDKEKVS